MFSPQTKITLLALAIASLAMSSSTATAQNAASAQFQSRMAAMQQARMRGQTQNDQQNVQAMPVQQSQPMMVEQSAPAVRQQVVRQASATSPSRNAGRRYAPANRVAQLITEDSMITGGAPLMGESVINGPIMNGQIMNGQIMNGQIMNGPMMNGQIMDGAVMNGTIIQDQMMNSGNVYGGEVMVSDDCGSCGDTGGYFLQDDCCGRGGCPDNVPCWTGPLGRALRSGSYFGGATAFQHSAFVRPGQTDANVLEEDQNFGAYAGFNLGIPMCRLFCGRVSGQFGMRSVQTNFGGSSVTDANRDQLFVTAGLYRRVDYGLQAGVVVDVLAEEFFAESDVAQLRGELSWAYPTGGAIGFRFATNLQDDSSAGNFNGNPIANFATTTDDHYRFFLRKVLPTGGFEEIFGGWTSEGQGAVGIDFDIPVAQRVAMQAGAVYFFDDMQNTQSNLGSTRINDVWNLYVGFAFRPQGPSWYRSYDRPLLPVADNGTMLLRR